MTLRLVLTVFFLLGVGMFSHAQGKKQTQPQAKLIIENGPDAIPVTVTSSPRKKKKAVGEKTKFEAPVIKKNGTRPAPPPPPPKPKSPKKSNEI